MGRVPEDLYRELLGLRGDGGGAYLFGAYPAQLTRFYERRNLPWMAREVRPDSDPEIVGEWSYKKVKAWSRSLPKGQATTHIFRKTSFQYAAGGGCKPPGRAGRPRQ